MNFEKELFDFIGDSRQFQGQVRSWMETTTSHIKAVSEKASDIRTELNFHKDNQNAHGLGTSNKVISGMVAWLGIAVSVVAVAVAVWAKK